MLQLEAPADAQALVLCCAATASAWAGCARDAWVRRRRSGADLEAAFKRACAANNGLAAGELLRVGWDGAEAAAAAAIARHIRSGEVAAVAAAVEWAAAAAPALLVPPSRCNGPLVLAAAAGRETLTRDITALLLGRLVGRGPTAAADLIPARPSASRAATNIIPGLLGDVQAQLDRALCVAAAGGFVAIIRQLQADGARCHRGGGGAPAGPAAAGRNPLGAAVLHRQADAIAALLAHPVAASRPSAEQLAAAAPMAASYGFASCLEAIAGWAARGGPAAAAALAAALAAAARADQPACAELCLRHLRAAAARRWRLTALEVVAAGAEDSDAICYIKINGGGRLLLAGSGDSGSSGGGSSCRSGSWGGGGGCGRLMEQRLSCAAAHLDDDPSQWLQSAMREALAAATPGSRTACLLQRQAAALAAGPGGAQSSAEGGLPAEPAASRRAVSCAAAGERGAGLWNRLTAVIFGH
jgi:hypothetical protein